MALANKVIYQNGAIREFEKPEVCEAIKVANANRWTVGLSPIEWDEREARLKKEYEENTKASGPGEEQTKEKKGIIYPTTFPKADFYHKYFLNEGYSALKESASQFNDALLDEQAKKIAELTKEKTNLEDQITILNACKEHNENVGRKQIKRLGKEISKLNSIIHDKNAVLSDVAEELRLSKIREKNLVEISQKYMKENEELKKELADKVVDKIDAQALKSAESALAYKEKVITDLTKKLKSINMNRHNERIYKKQLAEKDEVISDLGKELAEAKKLNAAKMVDINAKCMRAARESINDVFESYAAKYAKSSLDDLKEKAYESFNAKAHKLGLVGSKDGNGIIGQMIGADFAEEGADLCGVIVLCGKDFIDALKNVKDVWQE